MTESDYYAAIHQMPCQLCGHHEAEVAHYSGKYSARLGKGMGKKAWWHCAAALCRSCHLNMDGYKDFNNDDRALSFF